MNSVEINRVKDPGHGNGIMSEREDPDFPDIRDYQEKNNQSVWDINTSSNKIKWHFWRWRFWFGYLMLMVWTWILLKYIVNIISSLFILNRVFWLMNDHCSYTYVIGMNKNKIKDLFKVKALNKQFLNWKEREIAWLTEIAI